MGRFVVGSLAMRLCFTTGEIGDFRESLMTLSTRYLSLSVSEPLGSQRYKYVCKWELLVPIWISLRRVIIQHL